MSDCMHEWIILYAHCDERTVDRMRHCQRCDLRETQRFRLQLIESTAKQQAAAMSAQEWTTEKPTKPGYYWAEELCNGKLSRILVHVWWWVDEFVITYTGNDHPKSLKDTNYRWAGPLEPPR